MVDDSAVIRGMVSRLLDSDPGVRVVARAGDGAAAIAAVTAQAVDVVILDIEMPGMDGLSALPLLLRARPGVQVIMASTLTTRGADATLRALRLGAADYVAKPSVTGLSGDDFRNELLAKVKGLARRRRPSTPTVVPRAPSLRGLSPLLFAVGSSTGGPQALFSLFSALPAAPSVPVVITQHMPTAFVPILAEQLNKVGLMPTKVATQGLRLEPGHAYLAPGERHLLVTRGGDGFVAELADTPPENHCRPAVDPMLRTAAEAARGRVLVMMLTGMGSDGLAGTRAVIAAGGAALAQDEASSVVWGMPGAVAQAGLCQEVGPIPQIARTAAGLLAGRSGR